METKKLTREQANKIKVELNTVIGQYLFNGTLHTIQAECLLKWAYRRLKTWLSLLTACNDFVEGWPHFCNCINFDKSALDADAIRWMNEIPPKIGQALTKAKVG